MKAITETNEGLIQEDKPVNGKVKKKSGNRIKYNYIIVKSLKESQKNDVIKCLYIKSLTDFGFCVIKEGTNGDTKDKDGRDIRDRLIWQQQLHEMLQDKVRMPRYFGSFEENENYYLVMEYIRGKSLYRLFRDKCKEIREALICESKSGLVFLDYLLQIITILNTLHQQQIVHRDATPNNFLIMPGGKVAIIDMELSYSLKQQLPSPPFQLGTFGYMSPEQEAGQLPSIKDDVFSVGAIMLQMWTSISPSKLVNALLPELINKVNFFITDREIANTVVKCLHPDTNLRPSLQSIHQVINQYRNHLKKGVTRPRAQATWLTKDQILSTVQEAIGTLASPLMADPEKGWFSENMQSASDSEKGKINKAWYASYNRGAIGVIYMLGQAKSVGLDVNAALPTVQQGLSLVHKKYINKSNNVPPGLHFGSDGIAACLITAIYNGLLQPLPEYFEWTDKLLGKETSSINIMQGVAGQGIANLLYNSYVKSSKASERLHQYANYLLEKQNKDGTWIQSHKHNTKRVTRGFGNGMAGIIYFLLEYDRYFPRKETAAAAQRGLYWLIKNARKKKSATQWLSSTGKEVEPWWCEGAIGVAQTFLKAYQHFGESIYKEYAIGALYNHDHHVTDNNLSQCHGLSGLGEVYLEAYHILKEEIWLERATWIAQVIIHLKKVHPKYGPYWLVEHELKPVANFMVGNSGVLHFLLRYCYSERIAFPLLTTRAVGDQDKYTIMKETSTEEY